MSRKHRRKKKSQTGTIIFLSLVIVACIAVILAFSVYPEEAQGPLGTLIAESPLGSLTSGVKAAVTEKATEQILEKTLQEALESAGQPEAAAEAKKIVKNMDEEDKQTAEGIIGKYANGDTISDCLDIVGDGVNSETIAQVEQYLQNEMSDQDVSALKELYSKYAQ